MELRPIGIVRSSVTDLGQMPLAGVPARVEVYPDFAGGLLGIESNTNLMIMGWLEQADQSKLQVMGRRPVENGEARGVFGLRSSARPNPIGLTPARLVKVEGNVLHLDRLDMVDGTEVVDVKRYSPGWDCIPAARTVGCLTFPAQHKTLDVYEDMLTEAVNFHGERCVGAVLGMRAVYHAMRIWQIGRKDPALIAWMGREGCISDAIQGITGATLGNKRMKVPGGRKFRLTYQNMQLSFRPKTITQDNPEELFWSDIEELFDISAELMEPTTVEKPRKGIDPDVYDTLVEKVSNSLVNGFLPCAVAHKIADDMSIYVGEIGKVTDATGIKLSKCQLGCFK